jgi:hypothetical protein
MTSNPMVCRRPFVASLFGMIAAMLTCLSACRSPTPAAHQGLPGAAVAAAADAKTPTQREAEVRFGVSPTRNSQVTYQPGVIIMEHGAEAIRSEGADGFTWTIDANAPGAAEIERDKILFATGRMVGRVLAVKSNRDELAVTLGPVELTDLIAEAHIDYRGPLDPTSMIVYVAEPGYPGSFLKDPPQNDEPEADAAKPPIANRIEGSSQVYTVSRSGDLVPFQPRSARMPGIRTFNAGPQQPRLIATRYVTSDWRSQGFGGRTLQRSWNGAVEAQSFSSGGRSIGGAMAGVTTQLVDGFSFLPSFHNGLQLEVPFQKDGLTFSAKASMKLTNPEFRFILDIGHGLKTAAIELSGVGGIDVAIAGGTNGKFKNVHENFYIPVDYSFPIPALIPFSAMFRQSMRIDTVITWNQAVISSAGSYSLGGKITAGVVNGAATGTAPIFVTTNYGMADSLKGLSTGVNGLVVGWGGKFIVGLGKFGLVVGPYASVNVAAGVTLGSALQGGGACRASELDLSMKYGMGFAVPAWTVAALNEALDFFGFTRVKTDYEAELGNLSIKQASDGVPPKCASNAH